MSSIPPIQPSGWNNHISPPGSVENSGGGSGSPGYGRANTEKTDETEFHTLENQQDEFALLENKDLLTIIKEFLFSLWTKILNLLGIKTKDKADFTQSQ